MLQLYMDLASSRLACRDIQRIQRIQPIQLYSYTRYVYTLLYRALYSIQNSTSGRRSRHSVRTRGENSSTCVRRSLPQLQPDNLTA